MMILSIVLALLVVAMALICRELWQDCSNLLEHQKRLLDENVRLCERIADFETRAADYQKRVDALLADPEITHCGDQRAPLHDAPTESARLDCGCLRELGCLCKTGATQHGLREPKPAAADDPAKWAILPDETDQDAPTPPTPERTA